MGIVYILITGYHIYKLRPKEESCKCSEILYEHGQGMLIAFGGLCYFFGDNLPPLIKIYEGEIGITQGWVEAIQVAGIVALGAATVTYLPVLIDGALPHTKKEASKPIANRETAPEEKTEEHTTEEPLPLIAETAPEEKTEEEKTEEEKTEKEKTEEEKTEEEKTPAYLVFLLLLAKATNLDLVYTAIERVASNKCSASVICGAWAYYGIYFIAFFVVCLIEMINQYEKSTQGNKTCKRTLCKTVAVAILISVFAASYILADNRLPLACSGIAESDRVAQDKIRLSLWGATVFFGILVFICCCCYKMRYDKLVCVLTQFER